MVTGGTHDEGSPDGQEASLQQTRTNASANSEEGGSRSLKDRLKNPFPELRDKLKDTKLYDIKVGAIHLKHRIGKLENLVNTNHRHDEEHEQRTDAKRTRIGESHRFQSFAPERDGNLIKWYVDGRDYYHAVSVALENATQTIYIADWWLSPELFLRRPPYYNKHWRLDFTLKRAAERGVKIYVIVYREVAAALTCNSQHTKHALQALCPKGSPGYGNIRIMRHPDHNFLENASDMTFYWAHHEKFIVIDYNMAFIGGLDLCFGRWDVKQHPLADAHPAGVQNEVFPGQDFNNNRIMDFQTVEDWESNKLSKAEYGRMPWHDVAMGVVGPCIYDIAEHFVLRWNFCKRDKYKRDDEYDWLMLQGRTGEDEDLVGVQRPKHPVGDYILHPLGPIETKAAYPQQARLVPKETDDGRPAASRHDTDGTEVFHDAPEVLDEHGYTMEQHRFGRGVEKRMQSAEKRMQDADKRIREYGIHLPHLHGDEAKDDKLPAQEVPGEGHSHNDTSDSKENVEGDRAQPNADGVTDQQNKKMTGKDTKTEGTTSASGGVREKSKGYSSNIVEESDVKGGYGTVHAQLVRSSADWSSGILTEQSIQNAYCQVIRNAKHFVYIENQFFITATGPHQAPIHNLIGAAIVDACLSAAREGRKFRVIIVIPAIPGFAGDLRSDAAVGTRAIMDYQYKSICRGEHSIFGRLRAENVEPSQYIFIFNLRSYDRIDKNPSLLAKEEQSGVKYHEAQQAQEEELTRSATKGGTEPSSEKKKQFEDAALSTADGHDTTNSTSDSIAKDAMLGEKKVSEEDYPGRQPGGGYSIAQNEGIAEEKKLEQMREQEKDNFIQEELYIHGKLLIVDDRVVICGSSNINDRSQLGFHDSELSIVMEDTRPLESKMDGKDYVAGHHAATLRRTLWREHLGLLPAQPLEAGDDPNAQPPGQGDNDWMSGDEWDEFVADPLSDDLWQKWTGQATTNTLVFRQLFHADPDDNVKTFHDYDRFMPKGVLKAGHLFDPFQPVDSVRAELDKIRGHLVWFPLEFLQDAEMAEKGMQVNSWTESVYT